MQTRGSEAFLFNLYTDFQKSNQLVCRKYQILRLTVRSTPYVNCNLIHAVFLTRVIFDRELGVKNHF